MALRARMSPATGWVATVAAVVLAFVVVGIIASAVAPTPSGPPLSSYATTPRGVAAWATLLARDGHRVRKLRTPLSAAHLPADATLVVLGGAGQIAAADVRALRRFLGKGGLLVLGGNVAPGAKRLDGDVVAVPTPTFLENRTLADGGNAYRALALAGPAARPVIFDEDVHGFGAATGLAALPGRWWVAVGLLALALAGWSLSRAVRLGGSDPALAAAPPVPRLAYVHAMADTLARTANRQQLEARLDRYQPSNGEPAGDL